MDAAQQPDRPLQIRLFGQFEVRIDGQPLPHLRSRRGALLLALLTLRHGRAVEREWLGGLLWPDSEPGQMFANLRRTLTDLRAALGAQAIRLQSPTPHTLWLDLSGNASADVVLFDAAMASRDPARLELEEAIGLYRGPLLEDCFEEWVLGEREKRAQAYLKALDTLAQQSLRNGCLLEAIRFLRLLSVADPFNEQAHRHLMQALFDAGEYAAMTQCYRDLRLRLQRELNADLDSQTHSLFQTLRQQSRAGAQALPRYASHASPSSRQNQAGGASDQADIAHNLPDSLTSFIGRERERAEVGELLKTARLVTLTGSGGIGKTRLALQVAQEAKARSEYPDGIWFVDLSAISDAALVGQSIANALSVKEQAGIPLTETLAKHLKTCSLLLVLDNCEHLVAACASLATLLLSRCPTLRVLATSRETLNVQGERTWRVPSLRLPAFDSNSPPEKNLANALQEYDGIRLFVERAQWQRPDFALTRSNALDIVRIGRCLDGIPLAIELAAARIRTLSPEQIASRLSDRFRLLTQGNKGASPRHQTLLAAMDWSYHLLTLQEQTLLRRLSVFVGGWTLEAAERICADTAETLTVTVAQSIGHIQGATQTGSGAAREQPLTAPIEAEDIADLLCQLLDKSLIYVDRGVGDENRYAMLETVRQYGSQRETDAAEARRLREAHGAYFVALAETAEPFLLRREQGEWLDRLEAEHDNFRAAFGCCRLNEDRLRLAAALCRFWMVRGYGPQGRRWLEDALATGQGAPMPLRAKALTAIAAIVFHLGDYPESRAFQEENLRLHREMKDERGASMALNNLGQIDYETGDYEKALAFYTQSLDISRRLGDDLANMASALCNLAHIAENKGDNQNAYAYFVESLDLDRTLGNDAGIGYTLCQLATLAHREGKMAQARDRMQESLAVLRKIEHKRLIALCLSNLGIWAGEEQDYVRSRALLSESLTLYRELGSKQTVDQVLHCFASLEIGENRFERAACLMGASEARREAIGGIMTANQQAEDAEMVAQVRAGLEEQAFSAAWETGRSMTQDAAITYALAHS